MTNCFFAVYVMFSFMFSILFFLPLFPSQAYTSQIAVITMIALAVGEDSISSRERRERIIDGLLGLPGRC